MSRSLLIAIFIGLFVFPSSAQIPGLKGRTGYFKMPANVGDSDVVSKTVVFKLKTDYIDLVIGNNINHSDIQALLIAINGKIKRKHADDDDGAHGMGSQSATINPLSLIFEITYLDNFTLEQVVNQLYSSNIVQYAEPLYIPKLLYTTNDPAAVNQYYLTNINAYGAWDITKGDTNIVIGIVDTGVDILHPDLANNIKHNYNDPIDGVDNDGDGYIDNFSGWDLGENDNNPAPKVGNQHGTWVAGCAAATPDNGKGGAGVGFNVKVLPVKIANSGGYLVNAYDGVLYAVAHGCKIINTSWGTDGGYSQYCQEIVNYVHSKGCIWLAAAGNSNNQNLFYPASYDNVVSVGGTDQNDQKWLFNGSNGSNYNGSVDLSAPAKAIVTAYGTDQFINIGGGTSFASPQVAAAAALVLSKFPNYTVDQVVALLKATTDNINGIAFNAPYVGKLGTGRLNVYRALTESGFPYVQPYAVRATYGAISAGQTIDLWVDMLNALSPSAAVTATISTTNPYINIGVSTASYGSMTTLEKKSSAAPFSITVDNNMAYNELVSFSVQITDGTHTWNEQFYLRVNRDYVDVAVNNLVTSVTNFGAIGFDYGNYGQGVKYNGTSLMYEMGLMIGVDSTKVSATRDYEFLNDPSLTVASPGESDFDVKGTFNDFSNPLNSLQVEVSHKALAWTASADSKYVIVEYCVKNKGAVPINNTYVGLYSDFDIIDGRKNKVGYVPGRKLGYAYKDGGVYGGVQLLSNESANFYAINNDGSGGSINIYDGFSSSEQFTTLSSGLTRLSATEGDVGAVLSAGPLTIAKGDSVWVAFAILGGDDINDLNASANSALLKYKNLRGVKLEVTDFADVSCFGAADGKIAVNLSTGVAPYSVTWTNLPGESSTSLTALPVGTYMVKVKDKMKFETSQTFVVNEPTPLKLVTGVVQNIKCYGEKTGSVPLTVSGGTPNYYYNWHKSTIASVAAPRLPAGTHYLTVSDSRDCFVNDTITVTQAPKIVVNIAEVVNDTIGAAVGSAAVAVSGGNTPYSFLWNDPQAQRDVKANNLSAKVYTVLVSDKDNCSVTQMVSVAGKVGTSNGIEESDPAKYSMNAFPNPATAYFFVTFELLESGDTELALFDQSGKKVKQMISGFYTKGSYKVLVYTDDLSAGYYIYRLKTPMSSASGKVNVLN